MNVYERINANQYHPTCWPVFDKKGRSKYYSEKAKLERQFKKDLLEELGVTDNPKANLLFEKAWELGHSHGLTEVVSYAHDLVDLIR